MRVLDSIKTAVLSAALVLPALAGRAATEAEHPEATGQFAKEHPRRAEVNHRVERQRHELNRQLKEGKITKEQYDAEMAKLKAIKTEEKTDAKANGGHLTQDQKKNLNQELDGTHKDIKGDKSATPPPAN